MSGISYTKDAIDVINYSKEEAARTNSASIEPSHLMLGIIRNTEGYAARILESLYDSPRKIVRELVRSLLNVQQFSSPKVELKDLYFSEETTRILRLCLLESKLDDKESIGSEHLLLGIMKEEKNKAAQVLLNNDITYKKIKDIISREGALTPTSGLDFDENEEDEGIERHGMQRTGNSGRPYKGSSDHTSKSYGNRNENTDKNLSLLNKYGTDLTKAAAEGKLDKVIGRDKEIELSLIHI